MSPPSQNRKQGVGLGVGVGGGVGGSGVDVGRGVATGGWETGGWETGVARGAVGAAGADGATGSITWTILVTAGGCVGAGYSRLAERGAGDAGVAAGPGTKPSIANGPTLPAAAKPMRVPARHATATIVATCPRVLRRISAQARWTWLYTRA